GAAERPRPALLDADERPDEPVLRARGQLELELDLPADALDAAQQLVRRVLAEVVTALALGECERVDEPHAARARRERRLDDERPGHVAALGAVLARGRDRPVAGVGIE